MTCSRRDFMRLIGGAAVAAGGSSGCCPPANATLPKDSWYNVDRTRCITPQGMLSPVTIADIQNDIIEAQSTNPIRRVRAVGSGHSFSDINMTDGMLILLRRLDANLPFDGTLRPAPSGHTYVRVESGVTLHVLNQRLLDRGLALSNLGGYDAQTIAGSSRRPPMAPASNMAPLRAVSSRSSS